MTTESDPPRSSADTPGLDSRIFQQVQELSPDGFVICRSMRTADGTVEDFVCLYANPAAESIAGRSADSLVGARVRATLPGKRSVRIFKRCIQVVKTGQPWKGVFRYRRQGADRWFRALVVRLEDGFAATFSDITRSTRMEKHRAHKAALLESTGEGIYGLDLEGRFTFVNRSAAKMLGFARKELLGRRAHPLIHHHRADGTPYPYEECPVHRSLRSGKSVRLYDEVLWKKDGSSIAVEYSASPIIRSGEVEGAVVAFADISALKQAEEALRIRARQQAAVAEIGFHALAGWSTEMLLRSAISELCDTLKVDCCVFFEALPDEDEMRVREGSTCMGEEPEARVPISGDNHPGFTLLQGEPIVVEDFATETRFHVPAVFKEAGIVSGLGVVVSSRDRLLGVLAVYSTQPRRFRRDEVDFMLSLANVLAQAFERRRTEKALRDSEKQFRQAQKMEAVGQLAGGVAHDFNNLLTVIKGNAELGMMETASGDPMRELLDEIIRASTRATDLTRQLLAFSRRQVLQPKVFSLNTSISSMEKLLQRVIGENVSLRLQLDGELGLTQADPGQLEQVLVNLVVNARDAMPRGGSLVVETDNVAVTSSSAHDYPRYVQPGAYVRLRVHDSGVGIDEETMPRLFEPFFTTKEPGQGTGLGLSTVYGIIKQSGGYVWAQSVVGDGSTFTVLLPRVESEASRSPLATGVAERQTGLETVLLVEDEEAVRNLTRRILERRGYHVLEAADVESALDLCSRHPGPIHLALTDVILPGMSGRDLVERLAELSPSTRVLYMSGYTADVIAQQGVLEPGIALLEKPFSPSALLTRVREILDAEQQESGEGTVPVPPPAGER